MLLLSLKDRHIIEIEVTGPFNEQLKQNFHVLTIRSNPAPLGHVTGMYFVYKIKKIKSILNSIYFRV